MTPAGFYHWQGSTLILQVRIQPRASRDEISDPLQDYLKIRITAAPLQGKAHRHLQKYLAKVFKLPATRIELLSGKTDRNKRLAIHDPQHLPAMIAPHSEQPVFDTQFRANN